MRTLASAREEEGAGVGEWEELLHPGPQEAFYPTLPHDATPIPHFAPPSDHGGALGGRKPLWLLGSARWEAVGGHPSSAARRVAGRAAATAIAVWAPFRPPGVRLVGPGGRCRHDYAGRSGHRAVARPSSGRCPPSPPGADPPTIRA